MNVNLENVLEWPVRKIIFWHNEAAKLHNKLNPKEET